MGTISEAFDAYKAVDLRNKLPELVLATSYDMIVEVVQQMEKGEDSTGKKITPSYDPKLKFYNKQYPDFKGQLYKDVKAQLNAAPGNGTPDLFLTGKFYNSIRVSVTSDEYDIEPDSSVDYGQRLITRYGENILRMSDGSRAAYITGALLPAISKVFEEKTGIGII